MQSITSILLITKTQHQLAEQAALRIRQWLEYRHVATHCLPASTSEKTMLALSEQVQAVIVLGGDGTFVGVGRKLTGRNLPLLGINFGQVGFLAELPYSEWERVLERMLKGALPIRSHAVLRWTVTREGQCLRHGYAINDVVVGRGAVARVLPVHVTVDTEALGWIRSDGLIVSTPLGTSAYALSAHGALVHPDISTVALTPISPFFRSFPPMLLPATSTIVLEPGGSEAVLTIDGQEGVPLLDGDLVTAGTAPERLLLFSVDGNSYFQRLCDRGFIQTRSNRHPSAVTLEKDLI